jgi:hypothetical protein
MMGRNVWCCLAFLLYGATAPAGTLVFDTEAQWRRWQTPEGLVNISASGALELVKFRKDINAVADAHLFTHLSRSRGQEVSGGVWEAGSGQNTAELTIDGDPQTFWRPEADAPLKDRFIQIDLGRAVLAREIRLTFPAGAEVRPFEQFTVFIATGITSDPLDDLFIFEPVYATTRPNRETTVVIPLAFAAEDTAHVLDDGIESGDRNQYRLLQYINFTVEDLQGDGALAEIEVRGIGDNVSLGTVGRGLVLDGVTSRGNAGLFDADLNTTSTIEPVSFEFRDDTWQSQGTFFFADLGAVFWLDELFFYVLRRQEGSVGNQAGPSQGYRVLASDGEPSFSTDLPVPVKTDFDQLLLQPNPVGGNLRYMRFLFAPRRVRYLFWHPLSPKGWSSRWAELMLFSPGYPAEVVLRSDFIDLGRAAGDDLPKVVRSLAWQAQVPPQSRLRLRSRSGNKLERLVTFLHRNGASLTEAQYNSLPRVLRGAVDTTVVVGDDWDEWSASYRVSGQAFKSKSPRRFAQLELVLATDDPQVAPRVESLSIDFEDALLQGARGRIVPRDAAPNQDTRFAYTLLPQGGDSFGGFDLLRLRLPTAATDVQVRIGSQEIEPAAVDYHGDSLRIELPTAVVSDSVVVFFTTKVVQNATVFGADLGSSQRPGVWQSVEAASPRADIVLLPALPQSTNLVADLRLSSAVLTPNGDGANDQVEIRFVALKVVGRTPTVRIFDLAGQPVAALVATAETGPDFTYVWSGRDEGGEPVQPGIYLFRVDLGADAGKGSTTGLIAVAY